MTSPTKAKVKSFLFAHPPKCDSIAGQGLSDECRKTKLHYECRKTNSISVAALSEEYIYKKKFELAINTSKGHLLCLQLKTDWTNIATSSSRTCYWFLYARDYNVLL